MLFTLIIYRWKEELLNTKVQFDSIKEASIYELGVFNGFEAAGKEPTGMTLIEE